MSKRALVVEDDANIAELLRLYLGKDGFDVMIAADGGKAESSLVLRDIMLPVKDGWQICRDIRKKSSVPIIMLTAKGETADKINGLDMGADDYISKPFGMIELISRVKALLRRVGRNTEKNEEYKVGILSVNPSKHTVKVRGEEISLSFKEYTLLYELLNAHGAVCTRDMLLSKVWGEFYDESRTLDVHIRKLRVKLGDAGELIKTVKNVGYKLSDD